MLSFVKVFLNWKLVFLHFEVTVESQTISMRLKRYICFLIGARPIINLFATLQLSVICYHPVTTGGVGIGLVMDLRC